jgi:hypothetical protein
MDDPANTSVMADVSGNNKNGEYKNGTESGPEGISGDTNTARVFTGRDGYGFVNGIQAPLNKYTMAAFVKFNDASDGMIMQHGGGGALLRRGNDLIFHQVDTDIALTVPGVGIVPGCWYFVAGSYDGGTATIHAGTHDDVGLDCTPTTTGREYFTPVSGPADKWPSGKSTFYVGYGDQAPWLKGSIDEVAYFDHEVSATHLNEIWLADPPPARGSKTPARYSAPSSNPVPAADAPTVTGTKAPAATAKAKAAAKVKAARKALAKAKAEVKSLKKAGASRKAIIKAQAAVKARSAALTKARRAALRA